MRKKIHIKVFLACLGIGLMSTPAFADLDSGRKEYAAKHYKDALRELQAPAMAGDAEAQALRGKIYIEGYGAPHFSNARYWLQRAVIGGSEEAKYYLGLTNTVLALSDGKSDFRADPDATVDKQGKLLTYRIGNMVLRMPDGFDEPRIVQPLYGRDYGISFGLGASPAAVTNLLVLSAAPYKQSASGNATGDRQKLADECVSGTREGFERKFNGITAGKREKLDIAGAPAEKLTFNGAARNHPMNGLAYCVMAKDQMYAFQIIQFGPGDSPAMRAAAQAVESASFTDSK